VINQAYSKLLPKSGQSPPAPTQFLYQLSNITDCVQIAGQDRVKQNLGDRICFSCVFC
jgi:hypothetical protein